MVSSLALLALASGAAALSVTSPSSSTDWIVGDSETVTWSSVSTDPDSFSIYLSNEVDYPPTSILLASDVSTSAGSAKVDGSKLTAGHSFTINLTNGSKTEQIYAQSNQFNITESSTSSSSSSASASSTASSTGSSSSGSSTASATSTSSDSTASATASASGSSTASSSKSSSSTASSSKSSSSSSSSSGAGKLVAGWMGMAAVAALAL